MSLKLFRKPTIRSAMRYFYGNFDFGETYMSHVG